MLIISLKPNEVFVFGSNTQGRHGKGAAKQAMEFGAEYGKGAGHYGKTYAIITKELRKQSPPITLDFIAGQVKPFLWYTESHPGLDFLVTPIGTGLGGFKIEDIEPMFNRHSKNVILTWKL